MLVLTMITLGHLKKTSWEVKVVKSGHPRSLESKEAAFPSFSHTPEHCVCQPLGQDLMHVTLQKNPQQIRLDLESSSICYLLYDLEEANE